VNSFKIPFKIGKCPLRNIQFQHVTRLDFGTFFYRKHGKLLSCFL
jgi:hypothetical protein